MKFLSMLVLVLSLFAISCERHEFEGENGTKQLHHNPADHGDHHDDHKEEGHEKAAH